MKRFFVFLTALILSLALCSAALAAHGNRCGGRSPAYADANNDGVCDNRGTNGQGCAFADANNDGVCDNRGTHSQGGAFTDANNDGICDNQGTHNQSRSHGRHCGR